MYSVIIPTIWKQDLKHFKETLQYLEVLSIVKEVILIDNNPGFDHAVKDNLLENFTKVKRVSLSGNIYVNPAWNLGANIAKEEYLVFLNDDFYTVPSIFEIFITHHQHPDKENGIFGMSGSCYNTNHVTPGGIHVRSTEGRCFGWGCIIFIKKTNWSPIPGELKIWCGDDYITQKFIKEGKTVYTFANLWAPSPGVSSTDGEFNKIKENDIIMYKRKYADPQIYVPIF